MFLRKLVALAVLFVAGQVSANEIRDHLEASRKEVPLPLTKLLVAADKLEVKFQNDPNLEMADFVKGSWSLTPKLMLYEPYYRKNNQLVPVINLVIDTSEHYFYALTDAYLQLVVEKSNPAYFQYMKTRGAALFTDVPAQYQYQAYRNALADFGGTAFSVVLSAERSFKKQGKNICAVFDRPSSIFTLWEAYFFNDMAPFPGTWYTEENGKGEWHQSRFLLKKEDKLKVVAEVFDGFWKGTKEADFKNRFCQ